MSKSGMYASVLLMLISSCSDNDGLKVPSKSLIATSKVESLNDTIFFGLISGITASEESIYLSDAKNGNVLEVSPEFEFKGYFGNKGEGPGEFIAPLGSSLREKVLYVLDDGPTKINAYSVDRGYVNSFKKILPTSAEFIITADSNFLGSLLEFNLVTPPMFSYRFEDSLSTKRFGSHKRVLQNFNLNMPRHFFLRQYQDMIIAICENDPVIEVYNKNLTLIDVLDYSKLEYLEDFIFKQREAQSIDRKMVSNFVTGSEVRGNDLYILINGFNKKGDKFENNHVLKVSLNEAQIRPIELIELSNSNGNDVWYYSFSIHDNKFIGFDARSYELHVYDLK